MAIVATDLVKPSHVIKYEQAREHAFSRSANTAVEMPAVRVVGEVLVYVDANSRWETPATGITTGVVGVLADSEVYDVLTTNLAADYEVQLNIVDKAAIVAEPHLVFDSGLNATDITNIKALLVAQGVQLAQAVNTKDA